MKKNNLYFVKMWAPIIMKFILLILFINFYFQNVKYLVIIITIILVIVSIIISRRKVNNSINKFFKCETTKQIIEFYDKPYPSFLKSIKDLDALKIYTKSVACCYYGEFNTVNQMLSLINWNERTPYIQSLELSIRALICYLDTSDFEEGLSLSIISQQLGDVSELVPGSVKTKSFYETYIQVGKLLSGSIDGDIIESLEAKFKKESILIKLLIAYCLSKVYIQMNSKEKAEEKIQYCKQVAPYCKPLFI